MRTLVVTPSSHGAPMGSSPRHRRYDSLDTHKKTERKGEQGSHSRYDTRHTKIQKVRLQRKSQRDKEGRRENERRQR